MSGGRDRTPTKPHFGPTGIEDSKQTGKAVADLPSTEVSQDPCKLLLMDLKVNSIRWTPRESTPETVQVAVRQGERRPARNSPHSIYEARALE